MSGSAATNSRRNPSGNRTVLILSEGGRGFGASSGLVIWPSVRPCVVAKKANIKSLFNIR